MIDSEAMDVVGRAPRPNLATLIGAGGALALVSGMTLPWPVAIASTALGILMIAGADVDARTYLLPDAVTWGAALIGIIAAPLLDPLNPWLAVASALARAVGAAVVLALLRWCYARIRRREGLGFGDVKLAAAVGAWLPLELHTIVLRPCGERGSRHSIGCAFARSIHRANDEAAVRRIPLSGAVAGILCECDIGLARA